MDDNEYGAEEVDQNTLETTGTVKWFNPVKGFGFVTPVDGTADIFLHLSALHDVGVSELDAGTTVVCEVTQGPKGLQVVRVISVDTSTATEKSSLVDRETSLDSHAIVPEGNFFEATVKWFNADKGYGFITSGEDMPDVFIHIRTLRRYGITDLQSGQTVRVRTGKGPKGPQVAEIDVAS